MKEKRTAYIQMKVLPSVKSMAVESAEKAGRTMSNYIENLIKEDYERSTKMKKYVFEEYRDGAGTGSCRVYREKDTAVSVASERWDRLSENDKKSYMKDPVGTFHVYEIEMTTEQAENWEYSDLQYQDLWTADVWDALVERIIECTEFHEEKPWGDVWDTVEVVKGADAYDYDAKDFLRDNMETDYELTEDENPGEWAEYLKVKWYDDDVEKERIFIYRSKIRPVM